MSQDSNSRQRQEIAELRRRLEELEAEVAANGGQGDWRRQGFYGAYYATTGFLLGGFAAAVSLLLNVVGSMAWPTLSGQPELHPLRLIQVYLTFPLGEKALEINSGLTLAIGCFLYLGTGMVYGVLFQVVMARYASQRFVDRLIACSVMALAVWAINFYGILSWLQPLLFGGSWILSEVPWWVAALTHLAFGWSMAVLFPFGRFVPYESQTESP